MPADREEEEQPKQYGAYGGLEDQAAQQNNWQQNEFSQQNQYQSETNQNNAYETSRAQTTSATSFGNLNFTFSSIPPNSFTETS